MHTALGRHKDEDLTQLTPEVEETLTGRTIKLNFAGARGEIEAELLCTQLLDAIGSLKDALKVHCKKNGIPFDAETVIDLSKGGPSDTLIAMELFDPQPPCRSVELSSADTGSTFGLPL